MKIHPHTPKQPATIGQETGKTRRSGAPGVSDRSTGSAPPREPQTTIATARLLDRAFRVAQETPVVDVQRVESIRTRVVTGDYRIDDARVAERLIEHERALEA